MTKQRLEVIPLFSTPIFLPDEQFEMSESLLDFIKNIETIPIRRHKHKSSADYYVLEQKELAILKKFLEKQLKVYLHEVLKYSTTNNFYITQSWLTFNEPGEKHHTHWHQNSIVSGVFYIAGDVCPITFRTSQGIPPFGKTWLFEVAEFNLFNSALWQCENKKNTVILFPSTTEHYVQEYNGTGTRISLSFNTFVKGDIGSGIEKTEVRL